MQRMEDERKKRENPFPERQLLHVACCATSQTTGASYLRRPGTMTGQDAMSPSISHPLYTQETHVSTILFTKYEGPNWTRRLKRQRCVRQIYLP